MEALGWPGHQKKGPWVHGRVRGAERAAARPPGARGPSVVGRTGGGTKPSRAAIVTAPFHFRIQTFASLIRNNDALKRNTRTLV